MIKGKRQLWLVYIAYFLALTLLRWNKGWEWSLIWLWVGAVVGAGLELVDRLIYVYLTRPQDQLSQYVKHLVSNHKYQEVLRVLVIRGGEQGHLVSKSVLFVFGWIALAVYVITSTGSLLAVGIVLGAGLRLVYEVAADWPQKEKLKGWLFWQIKRPVSDRELKMVVGIFLVVFGILSIIMI